VSEARAYLLACDEGGNAMPHYLLQWTYKDPQIKALVETPQDRKAELQKVVESHHGTLHDFYFAFGKFDGIAIVEFPEVESCAACVLTLEAAGTNSVLETTVLITADEGRRAMVRASSTVATYQPPPG
jgi:uncharacterized protein with GYD domain